MVQPGTPPPPGTPAAPTAPPAQPAPPTQMPQGQAPTDPTAQFYAPSPQAEMQAQTTCPTCGGNGLSQGVSCAHCGGMGLLPTQPQTEPNAQVPEPIGQPPTAPQPGDAPGNPNAQTSQAAPKPPKTKAPSQAPDNTGGVPEQKDPSAVPTQKAGFFGKRDFDPGVGGGVDRDKLPASDFAGPHRSFPIKSPGDVSDAMHLVGHADDPAKVKANIKRIARKKGFPVPKKKAEKSLTTADFFKGDVVGHEFHGNQWAGGGGRGDDGSRSVQAHKVAIQTELRLRSGRTLSEGKLKSEATRNGKLDDKNYGQALKELHDEGKLKTIDGKTTLLSDRARAAGAAPDFRRYASMSVDEIRAEQGKVSKGDSPGHEFRGNQYTAGGGGAEHASDPSGRQGRAIGREVVGHLGSTASHVNVRSGWLGQHAVVTAKSGEDDSHMRNAKAKLDNAGMRTFSRGDGALVVQRPAMVSLRDAGRAGGMSHQWGTLGGAKAEGEPELQSFFVE